MRRGTAPGFNSDSPLARGLIAIGEPVGPTGQHAEWEVIHTFRYDDDGRLAEEWVQTGSLSLLTKLGVTTAESVPRGTNTR